MHLVFSVLACLRSSSQLCACVSVSYWYVSVCLGSLPDMCRGHSVVRVLLVSGRAGHNLSACMALQASLALDAIVDMSSQVM